MTKEMELQRDSNLNNLHDPVSSEEKYSEQGVGEASHDTVEINKRYSDEKTTAGESNSPKTKFSLPETYKSILGALIVAIATIASNIYISADQKDREHAIWSKQLIVAQKIKDRDRGRRIVKELRDLNADMTELKRNIGFNYFKSQVYIRNTQYASEENYDRIKDASDKYKALLIKWREKKEEFNSSLYEFSLFSNKELQDHISAFIKKTPNFKIKSESVLNEFKSEIDNKYITENNFTEEFNRYAVLAYNAEIDKNFERDFKNLREFIIKKTDVDIRKEVEL